MAGKRRTKHIPLEVNATILPSVELDPWKHRRTGMVCRTCMWFVIKSDSKLGRCRRHAPTLGGYPVVFKMDWCGDHKLDENKV